MSGRLIAVFAFPLLFLCSIVSAQKLTSNVPYVENGHQRQVLDIYTPKRAAGGSLPVMFWIHGGGWQAGDKSDVALKPRVLTERGFVFVSTNYRLLPHVKMDELIRDVAKALGHMLVRYTCHLSLLSEMIARHPLRITPESPVCPTRSGPREGPSRPRGT